MPYSKTILLLVAGLGTTLFSVAFSQQIGPGGVGTSSNIAFWLDASKLSLSDGDAVTTWDDESGNGNDATQSTGSAKPTYHSSSANMNSKPYVNFDGNDYVTTGAIAALNTDVLSWYTVFQNTGAVVAANKSVVYMANMASNDAMVNTRVLSNQFQVSARDAGLGYQYVSVAKTAAEIKIKRIAACIMEASDTLHFWLDGSLVGSNPNCNFASTNHDFTRIGSKSFGSPGFFFTGEIPEIITFSTEVNLAQNIIIQNYLSSKYSITCAGIDKFAYDALHGNEVAGIGREDASNEHMSAKGSDIVEITAKSLDNNDYLLWGNNDSTLTVTTSGTPAAYSSTGLMLKRVWRVDETGETDSLTFVFDVAGIGFGVPASYELLIDADGDFSNATRYTGSFSGDEFTVKIKGTELSDGDYFTLANPIVDIKSIVTGDWNATATWNCTCIPLVTEDVVIDATHVVTVTDARGVNSAVVVATGELVIASGGTLSVKENLTIEGAMDGKAGTLIFDGTNAQTFSSDAANVDLGDLTINNSNGLTLSTGSYSIYGTLTPTDGVLDLNSRSFTFKSDATGIAIIGVMGASASITNQSGVKSERYLAAGGAGNRNLGVPFTQMPLSEWDDELFISGTGFPDGCAYASPGAGCFFSARTWNAATQSYNSITSLSANISNATGIEIFLGDNLTTWSANTLSTSGSLNTAISTDITVASGWNYISNPFLSPIDFDNVTRNSANTGNYFYVYDGSAYQYWDGGAAAASVANLNGGIISPYQGFWVNHSGAASTITVNQGSKTAASTDNFLKKPTLGNTIAYFQVGIESLSSKEKIVSATGVKFEAGATKQMDGFDVPSLPVEINNSLVVYTQTEDGRDVVVNAVEDSEDCFSLSLYAYAKDEGEYQYSFNNLPSDYEVYIEDKTTGELIAVDETTQMNIYIEADKINSQYDLHFVKSKDCLNKSIENEENTVAIFATQMGFAINFEKEPAAYSVNVLDLAGRTVYRSGLISSSNRLEQISIDLPTGLYLVQLIDVNQKQTNISKVFIK